MIAKAAYQKQLSTSYLYSILFPSSMEKMLPCHGCRRKTPIKELKYGPEGVHLFCPYCKAGIQKKPEAKLAKPRDVEVMGTGERAIGSLKTTRYRCRACNYPFTRFCKIEDICPYCSARGTVVEEEDGGPLADMIDYV